MSFWEDLRKFRNFVMIQPNDRYDEFEYTRDLLSRMDISEFFIFIVDCNWIHELGFPYELLNKYKEYCLVNNLHLKILFLNLGEGDSYKKLKNEITHLNVIHNIDSKDIIVFSLAIPNNCDFNKHATTYRSTCREDILPCSRADIIPTHHFISLSRIPRKHRILANVEILKRNLGQYGFYSICSSAQSINNGRIQTYIHEIPEEYHNFFPTYLDGNTQDGLKLDWFYTVDNRITHAFFHCVLETSYEFVEQWGTNEIMISEKSMKPLAWGQVPIFLCYNKQVEKLRNLGFDLFDDLIDHKYDNEEDPTKRVILFADELERVCKSYSVTDLQQYKRANMHRFIENRQKTFEFFQNEKWTLSFNNLKQALEN